MSRREVKNPLAVIFYDEEKDQVLFETFPTKPGITIRPAEVAGMAQAVAQWFLTKLKVHATGVSEDIEELTQKAAEAGGPPKPHKRQPFILASTLCLCRHSHAGHIPSTRGERSKCLAEGCPCTEFRRGDL